MRVIHWDYSKLSLPLPTASGPLPGTVFNFEDFIIALKRVKNNVYGAFIQPEIKSVSPWQPTDWHETTGLELQISFAAGVKSSKIGALLVAITSEMEILIERECEYRDFLVCDEFRITASHYPVSSLKRAIVEKVVFKVSGTRTFLPSLLLLLVLLATALVM